MPNLLPWWSSVSASNNGELLWQGDLWNMWNQETCWRAIIVLFLDQHFISQCINGCWALAFQIWRCREISIHRAWWLRKRFFSNHYSMWTALQTLFLGTTNVARFSTIVTCILYCFIFYMMRMCNSEYYVLVCTLSIPHLLLNIGQSSVDIRIHLVSIKCILNTGAKTQSKEVTLIVN